MPNLITAFNKTDLANYCEDIEMALDYYDGEPYADEFIDWYVEEYIDSAEVLYSHTAMIYLAKHTNLQERLALARVNGYQTENMNSETLASLLLQQKLRSALYKLSPQLEEYFEAV